MLRYFSALTRQTVAHLQCLNVTATVVCSIPTPGNYYNFLVLLQSLENWAVSEERRKFLPLNASLSTTTFLISTLGLLFLTEITFENIVLFTLLASLIHY